MTIDGVLPFALASLAVSLTPGPSWLIVIASTSRGGPSSGLLAVAGNATGILAHATVAALGLNAVLQSSPTIARILPVAGAVCLIGIGARILTARRPSPVGDPPSSRRRNSYAAGLLTNLLNPKVPLLLWALLPQTVSSTEPSARVLAVCGLLHATIASLVLSALVALCLRATRSRDIVKHAPLGRRLCGTLLILLGLHWLVFP